MPLRLFLLLASIGLVWGGGRDALAAVTQRQPATLTCAEFIANPGSARWVALRDCDVALRAALNFYPTSGDSTADVDRIYVPIGDPADGSAPDSHVFLATRDSVLVTIYNGFADHYYTPYLEAQAYWDRHAAKMGEVRTVRGVVRRGAELAPHERDITINERTWDDIVVVDEGAEPDMAGSLLMIAGGLALAFGSLGLHRRIPRHESGAGLPG
jgi:hypothetical protein